MAPDDAWDSPDLGPVIEQIRSQTRLLRSIIESMGDGLVVADENGKFLMFNRVAEKLVGKGPTDVRPADWSEAYGIFRPDGTTPFPADELPLTRAIRGEDCDQVHLFIRNPAVPQGTHISVTGRPLRDEQGVIRGAVVVLRELTR